MNPTRKTLARFGPIDDRSVGKSTLAAAGLFRLRNGIHLQPGGTVLVRGGSGAVADAIRWQRLPEPRLPAEDGGGASGSSLRLVHPTHLHLIVRRFARHCGRNLTT